MLNVRTVYGIRYKSVQQWHCCTKTRLLYIFLLSYTPYVQKINKYIFDIIEGHTHLLVYSFSLFRITYTINTLERTSATASHTIVNKKKVLAMFVYYMAHIIPTYKYIQFCRLTFIVNKITRCMYTSTSTCTYICIS